MEESKRKSREGGTTPDPERVGSDDPDVKPKKKKNKTAAEPSKADPDDPEDKPKKRDKGKSPKKKKSKTAAEPSKTDPDDPEDKPTDPDDPEDKPTDPDDPEDKPKKHDKGKSPKKKKSKTAVEPSKTHPDDPEDKPKKHDKGKSPKKKKSKTAAEPSKTDPDDPEPPKTGADDPEHHKGKRQKKRKEIETTSDPSEIECDVKKLKVDYSPPKSSSSESEYEGICEPMQVGAVNLPEDVTEPELMAFFNGKPVHVVIRRFENEYSRSVIVFGSVADTKEALKLCGKKMRGIPIYIKPNGNSREIVLASGFNNQSTVKEIMKQLRSEFKSRGDVLNIFVPEDNETGGCLGFGYIYIDPQGVDGGDLWKSFEIDGLPITLTTASPKLCFEAEIVGKKKANDEDEKTALKKMLLPLNTSLPTLMYTQRRYSWTDKRPDITAESYKQETNDCWAAALHRAYSALLTLSGSPGPVLTRQDIIDGLDEAYQASGDGIERLKYAISFMEKYVKEMNIYRRPRGNDASSYEDFESFTLQLLATTPVMVTVECLPGFLSFDGQGIFSPSDMDCRMRTFEKFPIHCLLLTGNDVKDGIEYWKLHETKGKDWGVEGFIMMERHKCLLKSVVELKL
ncbi:nucleolin 2-like [Brassica rapa]|uniref:nucleolin 2-like n=1 Tax=Brassica campestris TaxID=3711 RepID=UPI00142E08F2|nr:nucleolin 2-like [Brassica rapa]